MRRPAEVFPPGEFLREELEERGWSQSDLAEIMGRSTTTTVSSILAGKRRITLDTARDLAAALGTSPEFWMNLDASYQLWGVRNDDRSAVSRRARLYELVPVREMAMRGWIELSDNVDVLERQVLDFLGLQSVSDKPASILHAARKSGSYKDADVTPTQRAWLIRARQLAETVQAERFSTKALEVALAELRLLMQAPQEVRQVSRILARAGVRLVIVEPLSGSKIDGAVFWLDASSPVIALSLRFDRLDNFWFTLLHEIKHVSEGERSLDIDMEAVPDGSAKEDQERRADEFATSFLVPPQQLDNFIARVRPLFSTQRVEAFALTLKVHPGIVVGQLQHRGEVAYSHFRGFLSSVRAYVTATTITDGWGTILSARL